MEDLIVKQVRDWLLAEKEEAYKEFSSSLLPGVNNVLGIRIPKLRKYAKSLVKQDYESFLSHACEYIEGIMLQGMLIGLIKEPPEQKLKRIKKFLPKIDNWAVCDTFCGGLKFTKENQALVWNFIEPLTTSDKEYEVRFALVMMLSYFINDEYIEKVLKLIHAVSHEGYYAKMGAAWAMSICYINYPDKSRPYIKTLQNQEIKIKSVRKICESLRIPKEEKTKIRNELL